MDPLIRSISGLRGIAGTSFNEEVIFSHIIAFLSIQKKGVILVARDGRSHGKNFLNYSCKVIIKAGFDVINCGIIPTPTAQFLVQKYNYSGGLILTASHNPSEWNGLKFLDRDGSFLAPNKTQLLLEKANQKIDLPTNNSGKIHHKREFWKEHVDNSLGISCIDLDKIKSKKYKVVIDAVNSAGSIIIPYLLEKMGCNVIKLNCDGNGKFSRNGEPLPQNLTKLSELVVSEKADFGLATDPDADRLALVDEKGKPFGEEYTLAIAIDEYLDSTKSKNPVVVNLSTSLLSEYACKKHKVKLIRSKVGETNVVEKMKKYHSEIGGEGNGGVILKESHLGRDSVNAILLIVNLFAKCGIPISDIRKKFPKYNLIKDKISVEKVDSKKVIDIIKQKINFEEIDDQDGCKLIWKDKWIHIRKSNTEPIIRIYAESIENEDLLSEITEIKNIIRDHKNKS
ncbi:MAG: phosphoglucosamine mutase [Candidatus Neomarinimicrobiota bacterium]|nr:phosphoglucosamine mutase [Candidatus Neomarinimicrobiota bacterium]